MLCFCYMDWRCCVNADTVGDKFPGERRDLQLRPSRNKQDQKTRSGDLVGRNNGCDQKGETMKSLVGWLGRVHEPHALSWLSLLRILDQLYLSKLPGREHDLHWFLL